VRYASHSKKRMGKRSGLQAAWAAQIAKHCVSCAQRLLSRRKASEKAGKAADAQRRARL
jgi:hypothetical protein